MNPHPYRARNAISPFASARLAWCLLLWLSVGIGLGHAQEPPLASAVTNGFVIEAYKGSVVIKESLSDAWTPIRQAGQVLEVGDSVQTKAKSAATVVNAAAAVGLDQDTLLAVEGERTLRAGGGTVFYKSLGQVTNQSLLVYLPGGRALAHGTEFAIQIDPTTGESTLTVLTGSVTLTNTLLNAGLTVDASQASYQATMSSNKAPAYTTARLDVTSLGHVIQWMLYYPGVVYLGDLGAEVTGIPELRSSLAAYRAGNLPSALTNYPAGRQPRSEMESIYRAALLLSAGQVKDCEATLAAIPFSVTSPSKEARLAQAIRRVIAAVTGEAPGPRLEPELATEWLAESYYLQAKGGTDRLDRSLEAAKHAVRLADDFGFAWAQQAELEFSFRHNEDARRCIDRAIQLSPENAQAYTVQGFLLAGQNKLPAALQSFQIAVALDPGLGNAWLGRGLVKIRKGDTQGGLVDLQVAVAQEPNRALLRSYLAKAYYLAGNLPRARSELAAAQKWDPGDPTPLLYSALINAQENRINDAIRELERSQELNDNRAVYRSGLLLDQDQAVRGANLASIYRDAGMIDVGIREASRAVSYDYANAAAHLFLASTYDALRDPRSVTLRYETPWENELLLANLLSPAAAGTFSQTVSQQEYSRLFEKDHLSVFNEAAYLGNGDWSDSFSQSGIFGNSSYSVDVNYIDIKGWTETGRTNEWTQNLAVTTKFKQQVSEKDNVFLELIYGDIQSGDLTQYYNPPPPPTSTNYIPPLRYDESQLPIALIGYHREWSPQSHTLFLAVRAEDTLELDDPGWVNNYVSSRPSYYTNHLYYQSQLVMYSLEAQQIWLSADGRFTTVAGGRYQWGTFDTTYSIVQQADDLPNPDDDTVLSRDRNYESPLQRGTFYFYQTAEVVPSVQLTAGLAYDNLTYPINHRRPPLPRPKEDGDVAQWSPKAGLIWSPGSNTHLRAEFARSLGGISFDQSFRLEPNQVAGLLQSYRSLIPENLVGAQVAPSFDTWAVAFDHRFPTGTYIGVGGEWLTSDAANAVGAYTGDDSRTTIRSQLDYREGNVLATVNQLVGENWSFGVAYRFSDAQLETTYADPRLRSGQQTAYLQSVDLPIRFNHPSGFFAMYNSQWFYQNNEDPGHPDQTGDSFWQLNFIAGWRLLQRRVEVAAGVLNLTDQNYHLSPLNFIPYIPRGRVFTAGLKLNF